MNAAIVGCGLIGHKRAQALQGVRLVACADVSVERARGLARQWPGCEAVKEWRQIADRKDVDLVVVATPHASLAPITAAMVSAEKHVLVEKPAALHADELPPIIAAAERQRVLVRVGFNHRYHRALRQAHDLVEKGAVGPLLFVRARYGHGGRIGYEKEWRADPRVSGGGELIDQGVHLIDLARWFLGDFVEIRGLAHTYFWSMPVDDNAFLLLTTAERRVAFLHASCTEWKNLFCFEIVGRDGKLQVDGLGGSYGVERLTHYHMLPQMGPPETTSWEYPMADDSWSVEFAEFLEDLRLGRQPTPTLTDAHAALRVVGDIYRESGYDHHP